MRTHRSVVLRAHNERALVPDIDAITLVTCGFLAETRPTVYFLGMAVAAGGCML